MNIDISTHQLQEATAKALEKEKVTLDDVINAWHAVGSLVKQQLFIGKGVRITAFGTFSIIGGNEPLFQMATDFGRQNSLKQKALTGTPDNIPITALNYASLGEMLDKPRDMMEKIITKLMYNLGSQIRSGRAVLLTVHRCCEITIGKGELRCDFTPEFVVEMKQGGPTPPTPAKKSNSAGGQQQQRSSAQLQRQQGQQPLRRPDSRETQASPRGLYQQRPGTAAAGESYSYGSAKPGSAAREGQLRRENLDRLQNQQARELASERPRPMYARRPQTAGDERARARPGSAGLGGAVAIQDRAQFFRAGEGVSESLGNPRAAAARALGTELIIEKVRQKIIERGGSGGIASVARLMKIMDDDGSRQLSRSELKCGLRDYGIDLTPTELEQVFLYFDRDRSGSINVDEFLIGLRGEINDRRRAMVQLAFESLDTDNSGVVDQDEIMAKYDFNAHPDVKAGRKTIKEAAREFMSSWEMAANLGNGLITYEDFEDHYKGVSASIDNDDYFELMIRNAWRIAGGQGQAANTANRRVLVTDKNGRQTVEQELGMRARDSNDVRGRLARQGLTDVNGVEMYGGMDTRDAPKGQPLSRPRTAWANNSNNNNPQQQYPRGSGRAGGPIPGPPAFDPFAELRKVVYEPAVSVEQLGQKLQVSMAAHNPRVAKGAFLSRLGTLAPALGRTELALVWKAIDPKDTGSIEVQAIHDALSTRFGKDKSSGKGQGVIERVIAKILERAGANGGLKGLQRTLSIMDNNGDKRLTKEELKYGLADFGIDLNIREIDDIFTFFDRDRNGFVDVTEFFVGVRGDLSENRARLVQMAFDVLDTDGSGVITADEIEDRYDVTHNPDVVSGKKSRDEALRDFMHTWDRDGNGLIPYEEFEDYYKEISASIDGDDYFELMIRNAWRIAGGQGQAANTANRRVLVTDKNGRQSVQTVEQELGMRARDSNDVRGRLARQGLTDVNGVEMYGGMDTRDAPKMTGGRPGGSQGMRPRQQGGAPAVNRPNSASQLLRNNTNNNSNNSNPNPRSSSNFLSPSSPAQGNRQQQQQQPKRTNAFERHAAALKLAAAYRGRMARKKTNEMRRFEDAAAQRKAEDDAEAARPKPRRIYRPQGKSYTGF